MKIEVYTKTTCPYCVSAKTWLKSKNLEFTEINLDDDVLKQEFYQKTGCRSVPQVFVDDMRIGGYTDLINSDFAKSISLQNFDEDF